jgi:predicted secreted protein
MIIAHIVHGTVLLSAFVVFWFLALFVLLPIGIGDCDPATGAPLRPHLGRKALYATGIAVVLWCGFYAAITLGWLDL